MLAVYKSSAGSGKTFTLVKEYLKLALSDELDPPQKYRKILAITFTNKASAEMKERIINSLKEIINPKENPSDSTMLGLIEQETGIKANVLAQRAKKVLGSILHNYSDFAIGTIDSFVHRIIRTFAFDLKLPLNFEIETDADELLKQAIDLLISKAGTDTELTNALVEFSQSKTDEEKSWHIESELHQLGKLLLEEKSHSYIEKLKNYSIADFLKTRKVLSKTIETYENKLVKIALEGQTIFTQSGLIEKDFYYGAKGIANYFKKIINGNFTDIEGNHYVKTTLGEDKWTAAKPSGHTLAVIEQIKGPIIEHYQAIQNLADANHANYVLSKLIIQNLYPLAVLNEIEKTLEEIKAQNNTIHISEFNKRIARIVMNEPVPFIYERLGEKYSHYLIDEFQDTSTLQWHNLLPLVENTLAENYYNMIVGDGKQAIYRWRGGEVEQFDKLPQIHNHNDNELLLSREDALIRNYEQKELNKNFRSKAEIIQFNNKLFRYASSLLNEAYQGIYKTLEQEFNPQNTGGYVELNFIEKENYQIQIEEKTIALIQGLINEGYNASDIAIITRDNKQGNELAVQLAAKNIPVLSNESILLKRAPQVQFLMNLNRFLLEPADKINQTAIVNYLISEKDKLGPIVSEYIQKDKFIEWINEQGFNFKPLALKKLPLYELFENLIDLFKLNKNPDPYLLFLLDEIHTWSNRRGNDLHNLYEHLIDQRYNPSISIPEGTNAVNVITIHRSKGLEYPIVIMPSAGWNTQKGERNIWITPPDELETSLPTAIVKVNQSLEETIYTDLYTEEKNKTLLDNINLLYVACTRAAERLYMFCEEPAKESDKISNTSAILYPFVKNELKDNKFQFGKALFNKHKNQTNENKFYPKTTLAVNWREKIKIRRSAPEIWDTEATNAKDLGVLIHTVLSKIKTNQDINLVLKEMTLKGAIDRDQSADLENQLKALLENSKIKPFFENNYVAIIEKEIMLPDGTSIRPDRVLISENETILIDFKTGRSSEKHLDQLATYATALSKMGYTNIKKVLIYTTESKVEWLN